MGLYFELQCTECGYHKTLYDGECGLEHLGAMKIKREFESGEGDPVYREIFERLKGTVTEKIVNDISHICKCHMLSIRVLYVMLTVQTSQPYAGYVVRIF